jgi:hypothetical protein
MTRRTLSTFLPALLALLLLAGSAVAVESPANRDGLMAGDQQVLAGAPDVALRAPRTLALGINMAPWDDLSLLDQFATESGRMPAVWGAWSTWGGPHGAFPATALEGLKARGVTPLLTWIANDSAEGKSNAYTYRKIVRGDHDAYLRSWALAAKAYGGTIILRVFHEMSGDWYPWGVGRFDNTSSRFKAAWRHVWNIFKGKKGVGATNVKFLWSPALPGNKRPSYKTLYPGDRYVDYVGFTAFNWARRGIRWQSMLSIYRAPMAQLKKLTRKPVAIAETGSNWKGGDKAAWIRDGYPAVYKKYPQVKVIVYFNVNMEPKHPDWSLKRPGSAWRAYRSVLGKTTFQGLVP